MSAYKKMYPEKLMIDSFVNECIVEMRHIQQKTFSTNNPLENVSSVNSSVLTFNIGPSFLHMILYNGISGRSFKYFYDFNNGSTTSSPFKDKYDFKKSICQNEDQVLKLSNDKRCVLKVNVYGEKCTCKKCLSGTFLFYGKQPCELKQELFQVLSSDYCSKWNENWIENLLEQMLIIFCCVKNGKVSERLLETACTVAKMLRVRQCRMDLLEFKYSYIYFHMLLRNTVLFPKCCKDGHCERKQTTFNFDFATVEQDLIDGFSILSFETEEEMNQFSNFEFYIRSKNPVSLLNYFNKNYFQSKKKVYDKKCSSVLSKNDEYIAKICKVTVNETWFKSMLGCQDNVNGGLDNKVCNLDKQILVQEIKSKRITSRVFEGDFLDEFLKNNSDPNITSGILNTHMASRTSEEIHFNWTKDLPDVSQGVMNFRQGMQESNQPQVFRNRDVPVFHGCGKKNNKFLVCTCKYFSLGIVLNLGQGRPLPKEAEKNLEILKRNDCIITFRMASIAACAVRGTKDEALNRVVVPVVSRNLIDFVQECEYNLAYAKKERSMMMPDNIMELSREVEEVLNDLLDNVCENQLQPCWEIAPAETPRKVRNKPGRKKMPKILRELHKLSASLVDKSALLDLVKSHKYCAHDICEKDCGCENPLRFLIDVPNHCEKKSCLVECTCSDGDDRDENNVELVEEMTSKHQTVISMMDGKNINITALSEKSKREKKLSTRFKNSVLLDEASLPAAISSLPAMRPRKRRNFHYLDDPPIVETESHDRVNYKNKYKLARRLDFCNGTIREGKTMADIFIWCANHDKYNCLCASWVSRMKENVLIWRPTKLKYITYKVLTRFVLPQQRLCQVFFYDPQEFSARTFGIPINYAARNRSNIFLAKRKCELENGVLSSTNSFIKNKFLIFKPLDMVEEKNDFGEECGRIDVFKGVCEENVLILPEDKNVPCEYIDVCNHVSTCAINEITSIPDRVEVKIEKETPSSDEIKSPVGKEDDGKEINLTLSDKIKEEKEIPNNDDTKVEKEFYKEINGTVKTYLNPENICDEREAKEFIQERPDSQSKCVQTEDWVHLAPSNTLLNEILDINDDSNMVSCQNEAPLENYTDLSSQNPLEQAPAKETTATFQDPLDTTKFDPELEHGLLKLKDHPLKEKIYGRDNLPNLSLLCLTPGIGYLPVVEYTPNLLVVQDPVFPGLLHSFKNLEAANIWLNKFLKDFFVFESIHIYLKWVIVKPGIIKLKQCQPFSPAILENSPIIFTKDGGLKFSNRDNNYRNILTVDRGKDCCENKRKFGQLSPDCIVDIEGNDGKRRKIHLETLPTSSGDMSKRIVNCQQYALKQGAVETFPSSSGDMSKRIVNCQQYGPKKGAVETFPTSSGDMSKRIANCQQYAPMKGAVETLPTSSGNMLQRIVNCQQYASKKGTVETLPTSSGNMLKRIVNCQQYAPKKGAVETLPASSGDMLKRTVNYQQYTPKKGAIVPILQQRGTSKIITNRNKSLPGGITSTHLKNLLTKTTNQQIFSSSSSKLPLITPTTGEYNVIPASILIPKNISTTFLHKNNHQNNVLSPMFKIVTSPGESIMKAKVVNFDGRPLIMTNKQLGTRNENPMYIANEKF